MKLAVSMYSYYRTVKSQGMDIPGFIRTAKEAGADGVKLLDFFYSDPINEREQAHEALKETGLPCPIFSVAQNFAKADPAEREAQLAKIVFGVDEAVRFGSDVVRVFAGDVSDGISYDQAFEWIVDGLSQASTYAAKRGKRLGLENHGKLAGRGDQVKKLIDVVRDRSGTDALVSKPRHGKLSARESAKPRSHPPSRPLRHDGPF